MNFDLAYQGLMARLDSIFPVNPEKHELIEITVRRIHLHGELKKTVFNGFFQATDQDGPDSPDRPRSAAGKGRMGFQEGSKAVCNNTMRAASWQANRETRSFYFCLLSRDSITNSKFRNKIENSRRIKSFSGRLKYPGARRYEKRRSGLPRAPPLHARAWRARMSGRRRETMRGGAPRL
ncbi:hypothetical protein [Burkholderia pseudomallei]|uniref:hypothetical protein n=1 Tax=Burkholderia pseudomallei TaxID=28450 RepID=UPI0021806EA7|nr:hypothetical protein [Burkholderia pseudomallei]